MIHRTWSRLEDINSRIHRDVERTVRGIVSHGSEEMWQEEISDTDIVKIGLKEYGMSEEELQRLLAPKETREEKAEAWNVYYRAVVRAGRLGAPLIRRHQKQAQKALELWKTYREAEIESSAALTARLPEALDIFLRYARGEDPGDREATGRAMELGSHLDRCIRNIMPLTLLLINCPAADPERLDSYLLEGEKALSAIEVWHAYRQILRLLPERPPLEDWRWQRWRNLIADLRADREGSR